MAHAKTFFIDIDGTLLTHVGGTAKILKSKQKALPGVIDQLDEWIYSGHQIVLTTARPETIRKFTEKQLRKLGIPYDQLVMGITHGERILINDDKPEFYTQTARGITVPRNCGLADVPKHLK